MIKFFWIILFAIFISATGYSQFDHIIFKNVETGGASGTQIDARVNIQMRNFTIESVLREIEKQTEYQFAYESGLFKNTDIVNVSWHKVPLSDALTELFAGRGITFQAKDGKITLQSAPDRASAAVTTTRITQPQFIVSGYTRDSLNNEILRRTTVCDKTNSKDATTNRNGFYRLTLPMGDVELVYSRKGYNTQTVSFYLLRDTVININLAVQELASPTERRASRTTRR